MNDIDGTSTPIQKSTWMSLFSCLRSFPEACRFCDAETFFLNILPQPSFNLGHARSPERCREERGCLANATKTVLTSHIMLYASCQNCREP